jgi:hypothetical protein
VSAPADDSAREKALMSEIAALRTSSESLLFAFDRVFPFAVALVVGGLGVGVTAGHPIVLSFIPFPLAVFYCYLLGLNTEGLSRAGHKRYLEEYVNELMGPIFLEEKYVAPQRQGKYKIGRPGVFLTQLSVAAILVVMATIGSIPAVQTGWLYAFAYFATFSIPLTALVFAARELSVAYEAGYEAAKKAIRGVAVVPPAGQLPTAHAPSSSGQPPTPPAIP